MRFIDLKYLLPIALTLLTGRAEAQKYAETVASQNPLAYYSLSDATDNEGGGNLNPNSATINDSSTPTLRPGNGFDGFASDNGWATFDNNSSHVLTDLVTGWDSDEGTISYWIRVEGSSTQTGVFANRSGGATTFSGPDMIATFVRGNGSFGINIDGTQIDADAGTLSVGAWQHLLFTWKRNLGSNNDELHAYLNGVLEKSKLDANLDLFTIDQARFGREIGGTTRSHDGGADELAIWDRCLSAQEITEQYQSGFIPAFIDTDFDDLDDNWELSFFNSLTNATGMGNNDGDTLNNLGEQARGSNPTLADTDGDGLNDDLEDGSRVFNGPGDPGSDPTLMDTDADGIDDAAEILITNGYITNPNTNDTDADGFTDLVEIMNGTDPTDDQSFPLALSLVINEIMTVNANGFEDGFGNPEDWIEIYNPNTNAINLQAYALSDNPSNPFKWSFPNITIGADDYLIVFASGLNTNDTAGYAHTNFKLDGNGEYLALTRLGNGSPEDEFTPAYPEQFPDISYGPRPSDFSLRYYDTPTPGAENGDGFPGVVADTTFNIDRGFYTNTQQVVISCATTNATIRYTTDGSWPSETLGLIYNGPISITNTTSLRAMAYFNDWLSTDVDTHSYIFIDQVVQQPEQPTGWPSDWEFDSQVGQDVAADYEMDPRVVTNALPGYSVEEALLDLPTLSVSMAPNDFLGPTGIYSNPRSRIERICSLELIHPDGSDGFQEDCEIEIHGNSSRTPFRMQKHSFRFTFKRALGAGKLDYPLIPGNETDSYNKFVLRACFTDSWGLNTWAPTRYRPNDSQYIRDVWMKESMKDMGHRSSDSTFMHLYVNGLYWGVFNPAERIDQDFCADNFGGDETDWDVVADLTSISAGNGNAWNAMYALANSGLSSTSAYAAIQEYIELGNFSDYMMLHFFANAEDWRNHNGYAIRNRAANEPFSFLVWDQEIVLDNYDIKYYDYSGSARPGRIFNQLRANDEYLVYFADRVYHNLYNNGPLSLGACQGRYLRIANQIDKAIVAESARWGDTQDNTPYGQTPDQPADPNDPDDLQYPAPPHNPIYFTREDSWLIERDNVITNHLPKMYASFISELRAENLYPSIDPPVFNQHGGNVSDSFPITLSAAVGDTWYTLDGSDPRNSATAVQYTTAVMLSQNPTEFKARALDNGEWSALAATTFTVNAQPPTLGDLVISEIHYNPVGNDETEFIELLNVSGQRLDLRELVLTNGVSFAFPAITLEADAYLLIVESTQAFSNLYQNPSSAYYTPGLNIAGAWNGRLSNTDDTLSLMMGTNVLLNTRYEATGLSNGFGPSLDSCHYHGSPGRADDCPDIRINEVLTGSWIEIASGTNDLNGLYLSNNRNDPLQVALPSTPIAPFTVFTNPVFFAEALISEAVGTNISRIFDYQSFGLGTNYGSYTRSDDVIDFPILQSPTPGTVNDLPWVSPIVISQFLVDPSTNRYEYVEISNTGDTTVDLTGWQLAGAISFIFPANTSLGGCQRILISETNSAAFGQPVLGPWQGRLDNAGETLQLIQPDGTVVESISYFGSSAWTSQHVQAAYHRLEYRNYANEPINWYTLGNYVSSPGAGPDPCAVSTSPLISTLASTNTFSWAAIPGETYRIEYRDELLGESWQLLSTVTANAIAESISLPAVTTPRRYYRVVWVR